MSKEKAMDGGGTDSVRAKVSLLLLDKLLIGLLLVGVGYWVDLRVRRFETVGDYQKKMFEQRFDAYMSLLEQAHKARDIAVVYYGAPEGGTGFLPNDDKYWIRRFQEAAERMPASEKSGFASSDYATFSDLLEGIRKVQQVRNEKSFYFPPNMNEHVNLFLDTLLSDLARSPSEARAQRTHGIAEWQRVDTQHAYDAYNDLYTAVRDSMRVEDLPLGNPSRAIRER